MSIKNNNIKTRIRLCLSKRLSLRIACRYSLVFLCLSVVTVTDARMYQWADPDTGITQLSGKPPPWYRSTQAGPRTFVFEYGHLIDDTGKTVTRSRRDELRRQAFIKATEQSTQQDNPQNSKQQNSNQGKTAIVPTLPSETSLEGLSAQEIERVLLEQGLLEQAPPEQELSEKALPE